MTHLHWRSAGTPADRFFVKGTRLASAVIPGTLHRFVIHEVRGGRDDEGYPTLRYGLADAATVSDAEVQAGKSARIVFWSDEPEGCIEKADAILRHGC